LRAKLSALTQWLRRSAHVKGHFDHAAEPVHSPPSLWQTTRALVREGGLRSFWRGYLLRFVMNRVRPYLCEGHRSPPELVAPFVLGIGRRWRRVHRSSAATTPLPRCSVR
jgi:hypothetical protein